MNGLKTTSVLEKLFHNSTREGQLSLVGAHDVKNSPLHYCNWSLVYFCFQSVDNIYKQVINILVESKVIGLCDINSRTSLLILIMTNQLQTN